MQFIKFINYLGQQEISYSQILYFKNEDIPKSHKTPKSPISVLTFRSGLIDWISNYLSLSALASKNPNTKTAGAFQFKQTSLDAKLASTSI